MNEPSARFTEAIVNGIRRMIPSRSVVSQHPPAKTPSATGLSPKELLDSVRDPAIFNFGPYGELGWISPEVRRIDPAVAADEELNRALGACSTWRGAYPETDDYPLVEWLEAVCNNELLFRSIAKFSGGVKPVGPVRYPLACTGGV